MIPDQFSPAASPHDQVKLLLPTLGLPSEVEAALHQALLEPPALPGPRGRFDLGGGWRLEGNAAGGTTLFQQAPGAPPRRWVYADGWGRLHGLLRWHPTGSTLRDMALRLPDGAWMEVHPRAAVHALWGDSDLLNLRHGRVTQRLASIQAVDYGCISHIPPLDVPAGLPPGAGEALLNTLAMLLHDQGMEAVRYRGPYPTEQLFHSLQRSFHCMQPEREALSAFARDEFTLALAGNMVENPVAWRPDPFAPVASEPHLLAAVRDGVEGVWLGAAPYRRSPPGGGPFAGGARVWPEQTGQGEVYRVGLILLGAPYSIHCTLDAQGGLLDWRKPEGVQEPEQNTERETEQEAQPAAPLYHGARPATPLYHGARPAAPLYHGARPAAPLYHGARPAAPHWHEAVFAWAAYNSTAALAPCITALAPRISLAWAHLPHALAEMRDDRLLLQAGVLLQFDRLRDGPRDSALGTMLISDVLSGALPHLRRRAQAELAKTGEPQLASLNQRGEAIRQAAGQTLNKVVPGLLQSLLGK